MWHRSNITEEDPHDVLMAWGSCDAAACDSACRSPQSYGHGLVRAQGRFVPTLVPADDEQLAVHGKGEADH